MQLKLEGTHEEITRCPYCNAEIEVMLDVSARADVQRVEKSIFTRCDQNQGPVIDYTPRLPNLGAYGDFWPGKIGETDCLTNGFFCLAGAEKLELSLVREERKVPNFSEIVDKYFPGDGLPLVKPRLCNNVLVQMVGKDVAGQKISLTARRRDIDFVLSLYPKAVFPWSAANKMIFVQSPIPGGYQIVGLVMSMDDSKDPVRWAKGE